MHADQATLNQNTLQILYHTSTVLNFIVAMASLPLHLCASFGSVGEDTKTHHKRTLAPKQTINRRLCVACFALNKKNTPPIATPNAILPPSPPLNGKAPRKHYNAIALAFLGDSIWEMYVRRHFFYPPTRISTYYSSVKTNVRAETQQQYYQQLVDHATLLTDEERDVLRWGTNATGTMPKRTTTGALSKESYREATALECLVGYLYLTQPTRLYEIMSVLGLTGVEEDEGIVGGEEVTE